MNSKPCIQIITTKPALSNLAASLKIPTITPKRLVMPIVITPASTDQKAPTGPSSALTARETAPLMAEKTSGLFDFDLENDKVDLDMETTLDNIGLDFEFETPIEQFVSSPPPTLNETNTKKSFSQKLKEANLKLNIIKADSDESNLDTPMNLNLDDTDLSKMTPGIQNQCMQFLQSMVDTPRLPSAHIATNAQIFSSLGLTETEIEKFIQSTSPVKVETTPFITAASAEIVLNKIETEEKSTTHLPPPPPPLDHVYSLKRSHPSEELDDSVCTDDDDDDKDSTADQPSTSQCKKQRRSRGIYRREDVTNQDEYANYLERRMKNNISSKISRANKKNYYCEMESKCETFQTQNQEIKDKIEKLDKIIKLMKEFFNDAVVINLKQNGK